MTKIVAQGGSNMDEHQIREYLQLFHVTGISNRDIKKLIRFFGTPAAALQADRPALEKAGFEREIVTQLLSRGDVRNETERRTDHAMNWLSQPLHHLICEADDDYPALLREISDSPALLFIRGDPAALSLPMIAIVGSRRCSHYGRTVAERMSRDLAKAGLAIVSGLASGVDTAAHYSALNAGGKTVAVLGNGLADIYPKANRRLADMIADLPSAGALVSELPLNAPPDSYHFPRRNRIISGLSLATCVVEASLRSGSLITARLANEQNRLVFAVPGSVNNPGSRGCHQLLRDGAAVAENAADIMSQLPVLLQGQLDLILGPAGVSCNRVMSPELKKLLSFINDDPVSQDELLGLSEISLPVLAEQLLTLELTGHIDRVGGRWVRVYPSG